MIIYLITGWCSFYSEYTYNGRRTCISMSLTATYPSSPGTKLVILIIVQYHSVLPTGYRRKFSNFKIFKITILFILKHIYFQLCQLLVQIKNIKLLPSVYLEIVSNQTQLILCYSESVPLSFHMKAHASYWRSQ